MTLIGGTGAVNPAWKAQEAREKRKTAEQDVDRRLAELGESLRKLREKGEAIFGESEHSEQSD